MTRYDIRDMAGGGVVSALGLFLLWNAFDYPLGTASRMGPGFFPTLLGGITFVLGLMIAGSGFLRSGTMPRVAWRPLVAVCASILCFVLAMRGLGLVPALLLTVCVSSLGDRAARPLGTMLLAAGCALGAWLLFDVGLGMPIPMFRWPA